MRSRLTSEDVSFEVLIPGEGVATVGTEDHDGEVEGRRVSTDKRNIERLDKKGNEEKKKKVVWGPRCSRRIDIGG